MKKEDADGKETPRIGARTRQRQRQEAEQAANQIRLAATAAAARRLEEAAAPQIRGRHADGHGELGRPAPPDRQRTAGPLRPFARQFGRFMVTTALQHLGIGAFTAAVVGSADLGIVVANLALNRLWWENAGHRIDFHGHPWVGWAYAGVAALSAYGGVLLMENWQ